MRILIAIACWCFVAPGLNAVEISVSEAPTQWAAMTIEMQGPNASESSRANPFSDFRIDVAFSLGDQTFSVPAYYAADGDAAETGADAGNIWRVHFVPSTPGEWAFEARFYAGPGVALPAKAPTDRELVALRTSGTFNVAPDDSARGLLVHSGGRYLTYSGDGLAFLKSGADSPENFLGYADFDGTQSLDQEGRQRAGEAATAPLHRYEPHVADWAPGDPTWGDGRGKGIIGAVNYLASVGVNSIYMMAMNLEGDGRDVWPYASPDDLARFDCSKLDQWNVVFDHMDRRGVALHFVLTETENESLFEAREGLPLGRGFADARKLYYRELVARFAHHGGVVWNLGEENGGDGDERPPAARGNSDRQRLQFAAYLKAIDPYDRPIVVHTYPNDYDRVYTPLLGDEAIDGPSLQIADAERIHSETLKWVRRSREAGRPWFVCFDELGPAADGVVTDEEDPAHDDVRRRCLWGNLMAGGAGVEWYFGYQHPHNDLNCEDFRSRAEMWRQTAVAEQFFHDHLPFTEMQPSDNLVSSASEAYCLAARGEAYAVYFLRGDAGAELELSPGKYSLRWFDPIAGGELQVGGVPTANVQGLRGRAMALGTPPGDVNRDWLVLVRRLPD